MNEIGKTEIAIGIFKRLEELDINIQEEEDIVVYRNFLMSKAKVIEFIQNNSILKTPLIGVVGDGKITVEWRDNNNNITSYIICDETKCTLIVTGGIK